jgi:hypothetical protein
MMSNTAIILGAGASRSASYIGPKDFQSALDRDFFKLLNQLTVADKGSINAHTVLNWVRELGPQYSRSLEKAFLLCNLARIFSKNSREREKYFPLMTTSLSSLLPASRRFCGKLTA